MRIGWFKIFLKVNSILNNFSLAEEVQTVGSLRVVLEGWIVNWRIFKLLRTWDRNLVCWERKNEFKHQAKGLEKIKILWFIVVRSHQTYIHYFDQPSQGFHQSPLNHERKQLLQTLQGEQPSSNPYKPKCFSHLQLNKSCYKRTCNKWSLDDQITHI